jgi:HEAT repeat protein
MSRQGSAGLSSADPEERRRATSELAGMDPEAVAELVAVALADSDWRVRKEGVAVALAVAPSVPMLERLIAAFKPSDNVGLRNAAVEALAGYGEAAVLGLQESLPDLDADGRKLAVDALGKGGQPRALAVLAPLLEDPDPNVRVASAEAIASLAVTGLTEAAPLLQSCLASKDALIALAALEGLNGLGVALPWETVARVAMVPVLRRAAWLAAGRSADARAVPMLVEALGVARGAAMLDVLSALRDLVREPSAVASLRAERRRLDAETLARVMALAWDDDARDSVRRAGIVVAAALGLDGAADAAVAALADDHYLAEAHEALSLIGPDAAPALVLAVRSGDSATRASCLSQLARFDEAPASALAAAREALDDPSSDVQTEALAVLSRFGDARCLEDVARRLVPESSASTAKAAEGALRQLALRHPAAARAIADAALHDPNAIHAACVVIAALALHGRAQGDTHLELLSGALSNPMTSIRRAAVEALAEVGMAQGVEPVAFALADEEPEVRRMAVVALGRIRADDGSAPGVPHLIDLVQHSQDSELVAAAARALGDARDQHAFAVLRPLVRSEHALVAVSAVEALAQLTGPRRLESLLDALTHSDAEVVKATMLALSDAPDPRVVAHLGACLDHDAWDVRRLAADLLGRVSGEPALGLLRARLAVEDSPPVQAAISRALERAAGIRRSQPPGGSLRPR